MAFDYEVYNPRAGKPSPIIQRTRRERNAWIKLLVFTAACASIVIYHLLS